MSSKWWHLKWYETRVEGRIARYGEAGEGPAFVFLHGWGMTDKTYRRALGRLVKLGVRVLAPALPGFGGTADLPRSRRSLDGYAEWVWRFLAEVGGAEEIYIGGHSFGGGVATKAASLHPERVKFLILVNSIGGSVWKAGDSGTRIRHLSERPLWDWGLHLPYEAMAKGTLRNVVPVITDDLVRNVIRNPMAFWHVAKIARGADLRAELTDLREHVPIVVLWGREDKILPPSALAALVEAAGGEPQIVPGAHGWLIEQPDALSELMTNVLAIDELAERSGGKLAG